MSFTLRAEGGAQLADRDEIRRALGILIDSAQATELVGLPSGRSKPCAGSDLDAAVDAASDLSDGAGVYYRINPCRPGLSKSANNGDIVARRWLLIDCDPVRPGGTSATDVEKTAGIEHARTIGEFLASQGWPDPLWVDSGNGVQLLYRIDLVADNLSRQWIKAILATLGDRFDGPESRVDRGVHRANQLAKLPGTWARKGDGLGDRPHRMARLVSVPATIEIVTADQLGAMAGMAAGGTQNPQLKGGSPSPPPSATAPSNGHANGHAANPWGARATTHTLVDYVQSAIRRECAIVEMTPQGDRNNALNTAAFNLGTMADWPEMGHADAKMALHAAARAAGLEEIETEKTIASGWEAGAARGRERPATGSGGRARADAINGRMSPNPVPPARLTTRGDQVRSKKVRWLWPDRIAIGFISLFAGRTGIGKSFVALDFAARLTRGDLIPDSMIRVPRGNVLIISEDPHEYVLAPRLIEMNADMKSVFFFTWEAMAAYQLGDVATLERAYQEAGCPSLIIIDPPSNFLRAKDEHKNAEVRQILMGIVAWLADKPVACVMITHVSKPGQKTVDAIDRIMGSVAWASTSRVAVGFAADRKNKARCLMVGIKNNLGPKADTLGYQIQKTDSLAVVTWHGVVSGTDADEAMGHVEKKSAGQEATEWVADRFREQRRWESNELRQLAKEAGISTDAIFKGAEVRALPIDKRPHHEPDGTRKWYWTAKPGWPGERDETCESSESSESCDATRCDETENQFSHKQTRSRKIQLSEDSELSHVSDVVLSGETSAKLLKARAMRQLIGMMMGGPIARDRAVVVAAEVGIPLSVLNEARDDLGLESVVEDGHEVWSMP